MNTNHCIALILTASVAGTAVTYSFMRYRESAMRAAAASNKPPEVPVLLSSALPARRSFTLDVPWIGTVESRASVEMITLISGRVETLQAEDQAPVQKSDTVMRLGGSQIEAARKRLATEIEYLGAQVDIARQTAERLEQSLRAQMVTRSKAAAARDAQIKLESQLSEVRLSLQTLENQVELRAPISGIFTNRRVDIGQEIAAGQVVGGVIDTRQLRIVASVFPPQGIQLQGRQATIQLSEGRTLAGVVRRVLPHAVTTGAVMVWIQGSEIDAHFRPGETVGGRLAVKVAPDVLAVPESAIVYDSQDHPYLFISENGAYQRRSVELGLAQDGWVQVLSGLDQSQPVVTRGAYELFYRRFNEQFKPED
jgi:RND family efflux transporter MFP subunit